MVCLKVWLQAALWLKTSAQLHIRAPQRPSSATTETSGVFAKVCVRGGAARPRLALGTFLLFLLVWPWGSACFLLTLLALGIFLLTLCLGVLLSDKPLQDVVVGLREVAQPQDLLEVAQLQDLLLDLIDPVALCCKCDSKLRLELVNKVLEPWDDLLFVGPLAVQSGVAGLEHLYALAELEHLLLRIENELSQLL